jgi:DNA segregation ATPase FtsK/SpoIIIE-like protein
MPHLLIAGRTGTGKSVCLNTIILSLLLTRRPDECRMIMIDPKKVELSEYAKIPHLMHPVVKDEKKAEAILAWAVDKMEERYDLLRRARVRNIACYNELGYEEMVRRVESRRARRSAKASPQDAVHRHRRRRGGRPDHAMKKEVEGTSSCWPRSRGPRASTWSWRRRSRRWTSSPG